MKTGITQLNGFVAIFCTTYKSGFHHVGAPSTVKKLLEWTFSEM